MRALKSLRALFSFKKLDREEIYHYQNISAPNIMRAFDGVKYVIVTDREYDIFKTDFILNDGYKKFSSWLKGNSLMKWSHNWDCDNFAGAFKLYMSGFHARVNKNNLTCSEGCAVGECFYTAEKDPAKGISGGHAINVAFVPDAKYKYRKIYIEPQTGKQLFLTKAEEKSIWFIRF